MSWSPPPHDPRLVLLEPEFHGGPGFETDEGLPPVLADLSTNVNPFLPDEAVRRAAADVPLGVYPDPESREARMELGRFWGVPPERMLLAPGAADLVHRVARCWAGPGVSALIAGPTFGEYGHALRLYGTRTREVRGGAPSFALPVDDLVAVIRAERPTLVFLCTPNNPTGEALDADAVRAVAEAVPAGTLLVLDESYRSFAEGGLVPPHLPHDDRVLHVRSFTKDLGLPGLRIAVAVGASEVLRPLARAAPPWSVAGPAQAALRAALLPASQAALERSMARIRARRERLAAAVASRGWAPLPSSTGFFLSEVRAAEDVARSLRLEGVRVRTCDSFGLPNHIRVGVPDEDEEAVFLEALDRIRARARGVHLSSRTEG